MVPKIDAVDPCLALTGHPIELKEYALAGKFGGDGDSFFDGILAAAREDDSLRYSVAGEPNVLPRRWVYRVLPEVGRRRGADLPDAVQRDHGLLDRKSRRG
jgi:hypothetical protein